MQQDNGMSAFRVIETDQINDSFIRTMFGPSILTRLLSFRCREAQSQTLSNQDYAKVSYRRDTSSLSFCVCDGVSSSYKGDFAACCVSTYLVKWLQELDDPTQKSAKLTTELRSQLDRLAVPAQAQLVKLVSPPDTPDLVREVLEDLCTTYGSETVFFCGRLDYDTNSAQVQAQLKHALFFWMGNVTARLFMTPEQYIVLGEKTDKSGRWSTLHGCRGELQTWRLPLPILGRLMVHTDGLDTLGEQLTDLNDDDWLAQVQQLLILPTSDDMTALDLCWQPAINEEGPLL